MNIVTRKEWGMLVPKSSYASNNADKIVVHHNGYGHQPNIPMFRGVESIKAVESWHRDTNGWNALGYHFIIAPNGDIYEGRPIFSRGAHSGSGNINSIGILVWGHFDHEEPTRSQLIALQSLITEWFPHIDHRHIYGHNHYSNTKCPGVNLDNHLKHMRETGRLLAEIDVVDKRGTVESPLFVKNREINLISEAITSPLSTIPTVSFKSSSIDPTIENIKSCLQSSANALNAAIELIKNMENKK